MRILSTTIFTLLFTISFSTAQAADLDLSLDTGDKPTQPSLSDSDWVLLKKAAKEALDNHPDSTSHVWKNNGTSNAGVITILSTEKNESRYCRNTRFITNVGELTATTFVNLCKKGDKWIEASPRSTTTTSKKGVANSSSSIMFVDPSSFIQFNDSSTSSNVNENSSSEVSERCRRLAADIDNLKGKPLRRNAAKNYYETECLR